MNESPKPADLLNDYHNPGGFMPGWVDNVLDALKVREKEAEEFFERLEGRAKADPDAVVTFTLHPDPKREAGRQYKADISRSFETEAMSEWDKRHQDYLKTKREFESGATRDTDDDKLDYEGFLSPLVLQEFAEYMHGHRFMKDGTVRDSDNWQKGFPEGVAEKSLARHYMDLWIMHRLGATEYTRPNGEHVTKREALAGIFFNVQAIWLTEIQKDCDV